MERENSTLEEGRKGAIKHINPGIEPPFPIAASGLPTPHNEPSSAVGQRPDGPGGMELTEGMPKRRASRGLKPAPNKPRPKPGTSGPAARTVGRDGTGLSRGWRSGSAYDH